MNNNFYLKANRHLVLFIASIPFLCISCLDNGSKEKANFKKVFGSGIILGPVDSTSIKWETTYYDLGIQKRGPDMEIEFPFKNSGDKPLVIDSITVTCGCTLFKIPEGPVNPGKTDKIRIKFVSSEQPLAIMEKHIYVKANTKGHPDHILAFKIELID